MMKKDVCYLVTGLLLACAPAFSAFGQVAINFTGNPPDPSSALDVQSQDKGFLPPRMTTSERNAILSPSEGLIIFNTSTHCMEVFTGVAWKNMCGFDACVSAPSVPSGLAATLITEDGFTANWQSVATANAYFIDVSAASDFSSFVSGYSDLLVTGNSLEVTGLAPATSYYYRIRAANSCGNSSSSTVITAVTSSPTYLIGETGPAGGVVFYTTNGGLNGLEAALTDQSAGAEWGCLGSFISGADGQTIGTGAQNTVDIELECLTAGTAADLCANFVFGGYSDWFLPSKAELYQLYLEKVAVGGFANDYYFSSSEANENNAWRQNFFDGGQDTGNKNSVYRVRAIRSF